MLPIAPDTLLQQRYRILNILAEGGLGRTYMAIDRDRDNAYCAIEELIPSSQLASAVAGAKEFFKQEVTLLYQLQHPQIPRFWTTFEEPNRLFLVRDYITGKTYGHLLEEHRDRGAAFSEAEVRQLLGQILPVIGYIHSKGIVHGDLSPEHIIHRDSDGLPVLIDFGVIREFANKLQATPAHQQMSPRQLGYAPAEQLHHKQAYPNSDLYAVAVTAIVLMTGKEPSALFEGDMMNWGWRQWTQIDDGFAQILSRMLSPDPRDRYQSAIEVERDLQSLDSPNLQPPEGLNAERPSTIPTVVAGGKSIPVTERVQTAITNRSAKSIWEQPQVFIPLGVLISLLAGVGSWFGVTQLLHRQVSDPVASTPPKQDFNNPTIPTNSSSPSPIASDLIQPEMDRAILKEGTVNADPPIRYRIAALAGQNLDIELISAIDPTKSLSSPISPIAPSPGTKDTNVNSPRSVLTPATTQVLMTILSPTGTPIDNKSERVVNWRGQVQTSGEYTVELRPIKGLAGSEFAYKLSITQLAVTPTPSPVMSPSSAGIPSPGVPIPIGGNGINGSPANLNPDRIDPNIPGISPSSLPIEVPVARPTPTPSESERPTRRRRRNRTQVEPSPQVRDRNRVDSTAESTSTPSRRRSRDSETRQPQSPSPSNPDVGDNPPSETPKPEPSIGIPVPAAKNNTPPARDGDRAAPPPGSGANDPD
ncbi:protein kinase [Chamaesiphon sp.]|uniref:serine/threonine protein kinase n=1 Tax=Chamaesiphon sp. TaxID=2814140 RepID=UPI003593F687